MRTSVYIFFLLIGLSRYTANRQYGKALPFFLRLRRPNVFDLIREHNLFTDVQDQALLLVEFDQELNEKRKQVGHENTLSQSEAITLLVNHTHSIPVSCFILMSSHFNPCSSTGGTRCAAIRPSAIVLVPLS